VQPEGSSGFGAVAAVPTPDESSKQQMFGDDFKDDDLLRLWANSPNTMGDPSLFAISPANAAMAISPANAAAAAAASSSMAAPSGGGGRTRRSAKGASPPAAYQLKGKPAAFAAAGGAVAGGAYAAAVAAASAQIKGGPRRAGRTGSGSERGSERSMDSDDLNRLASEALGPGFGALPSWGGGGGGGGFSPANSGGGAQLSLDKAASFGLDGDDLFWLQGGAN